MLLKDCGPSSVVFSDIIMLQRCLNDILMSLNSIYMLVKVFNDIIMLQRCLNDIIMSWEQKGARLRVMSHTHRHCDRAYCCADLFRQHDVCCLKQTCTPKGAARKYLNTVTDVNWGDTEIAERGRSVLVMRARYRSAGLTPHQRGWTDAG